MMSKSLKPNPQPLTPIKHKKAVLFRTAFSNYLYLVYGFTNCKFTVVLPAFKSFAAVSSVTVVDVIAEVIL
jgi:hypothetical protein